MSNHLGMMVKPSTNNDWYGSYLEIINMIALMGMPDNCYFVSPKFADANLGADIASASDRRFFPTLQAAHDGVSSGTGYNKRAIIFVYPGQYQENLVLTKTVTYVSTVQSWYRALGALRAVELLGSTVQAPLVTINPPDSTEVNVGFVGFVMENANYVSTTSGNIAKAIIAKMNAQSVYGAARNALSFVGCDIRAQCYGNANDWQAGIWAAGWSGINLRDCNYKSGVYGAGANNAGVQNMFYARGNTANGKSCSIQIVSSRIAHTYRGVVTATPSVFNLDDSAAGDCGQSAVKACTTVGGESIVNGVTKTLGATGTNVMTGVVAGDYATYGNILGIDLTGL